MPLLKSLVQFGIADASGPGKVKNLAHVDTSEVHFVIVAFSHKWKEPACR